MKSHQPAAAEGLRCFAESACVMVFRSHVDPPPARLEEWREAEAKDGAAPLRCR